MTWLGDATTSPYPPVIGRSEPWLSLPTYFRSEVFWVPLPKPHCSCVWSDHPKRPTLVYTLENPRSQVFWVPLPPPTLTVIGQITQNYLSLHPWEPQEPGILSPPPSTHSGCDWSDHPKRPTLVYTLENPRSQVFWVSLPPPTLSVFGQITQKDLP
jgi:hypothetical protein